MENNYIEELKGLIADVNRKEIYNHIMFGTLDEWLNAWKKAANACVDCIKITSKSEGLHCEENK